MAWNAEDERPKPKTVHEIGQNLALLSVEELDERMVLLRHEIERIQADREKKLASMAAAAAFFKR